MAVPSVQATTADKTLETEEKQGTCIGTTLVRGVNAIAWRVFEKLKFTPIALGQIHSDPNAFGRLLELGGYAYAIARPGNFADMTQRFSTTKGVVDTVQTFDCVNYFGTPSKEKSVAQSLGYGAMLAACIGGGMEILDNCKLISLGRIAERIGSIPVIGQVTQTGLGFGQVLTGVVAIGYICFGVDACIRLKNAETDDKRRQAVIDLAWAVSEVALKIIVVCSGAQIGVVIALGTLAAALGIVSCLHRASVKDREASQAPKMLNINT